MDWRPMRWYRVLDEDGNLWCETSDPEEAKKAAASLSRLNGGVFTACVERQYVTKQYKWVKQG